VYQTDQSLWGGRVIQAPARNNRRRAADTPGVERHPYHARLYGGGAIGDYTLRWAAVAGVALMVTTPPALGHGLRADPYLPVAAIDRPLMPAGGTAIDQAAYQGAMIERDHAATRGAVSIG
jgi:hypothetical protein